MSEDLTSIGIGVDSTQINTGAKALDNFTDSAKKAGGSATASSQDFDKLTAAVAKAAAAQYGLTQAQVAGQKISFGTTVLGHVAALQQESKEWGVVAAAVNASTATQLAAHEKIKISTLAIREPIVLLREAMRGDFSRMAGSATLLAQAFGLLTAATLPYIGVILAIGAAIASVTASVVNYKNYLGILTESTLGLGRATGLTAEQLGDMAKKVSDSTNLSTQSVAKMQQELIRMGDTNASVFDGIIQHLDDYVTLTGEKAPQALSELGKAFVDPIQGYLTITEKVGGFNLKTLEQIEQAQRAGDDLKARAVLMETLAQNTNDAANAVGGLHLAWEKFLKGAGNFALGVGSFFSGVSDQQRASAYSGFGYNPALESQKQDQSRAQAAAQANAEQERNNQINRQGLATYNALAPKHVEINKLLQQEADIRKSMNTPGGLTQAQGQEALTEAQLKINALNKQLAGPHHTTPHEYTTLAQELDLYNVKLNQANSLYGIFDEAQSSAIAKTNQEVLAIEKKHDAKNHLISVDAETIAQMLTLQEQAHHNQDVDKQGIAIYNDLNKAANDYLDTLQAIEIGLANGSFSSAQANAAQNSAQDKYNTQSDPTYQINRQLDEQTKLYAILGPQREIQRQLDDIAYNAMQANHPLSEQAISDLRTKLELAQEQTELDTRRTALFNQSYGEQQRQINLDAQALNTLHSQKDAYGQLIITSQQYQVQLRHIEQLQLELSAQKAGGAGGFAISMVAGLHRLLDTGKTVSQQLTGVFGDFFSSVEEGVANSFGKWLTGAETLGQALREVATTALQGLISGLVKIGEQMLINAIIGKTIEASTNAITLASQVALAPVLAANALNMSIISFGAAAVAGGTAFASAQVIGKITDLVGLFADGGMINGPGGPKDDKVLIAASNGEFVVNAEATARNRSLLEYINNSKNSAPTSRFASGGLVGQTANHNAVNDNPTYYNDFRGANFGGADADVIMQRVDMAMRQIYGPQIVKVAAQTTLKTGAKLNSRQPMNAYSSKA